jgi:hypothetical protein
MAKLTRADFMSPNQRMPAGMQRTHENCIVETGVARPGKTAHERYKRNRRERGQSADG